MKIFKIPVLFLMIGLTGGWFIFSPGEAAPEEVHGHDVSTGNTVWTCSMHPQIQSPVEGECALCGMDLIPMEANKVSLSDNEVLISIDEINNSGIKTVSVMRKKAGRELHLFGYSLADRNSVKNQTVHFSGRITGMNVNYPGRKVKKGEVIAQIYSPELITAQMEFLETVKIKDSSPSVYSSAKRKLELLNISSSDISAIENKGKIIEFFNIRSDHSGYADVINVREGDYVNKGKALYSLYSLDNIWFEFELYNRDLASVKEGDSILVVTADGTGIAGTVDFIEPSNDTGSASSVLRVSTVNDSGLRPGVYAEAFIQTEPGQERTVVPRSSVLWTGKRSVAYVKKDSNVFEMKDVVLGERAGQYYVIEEGLEEGEEVVSRALFTLDAAAQLQGRNSMMNRDIPAGRTMITDASVSRYINIITDRYLEMKDFLVASDASGAASAARTISTTDPGLSDSWYSSDDGQEFLKIIIDIMVNSEKIAASEDIEVQRALFENVSNSMIELAGTFETGRELYVQHCPMAFNDKGADWLSGSDKILNPYFGEAMLRCGNVKKKF